ncbi:MAG: type IV pilus biogenesis/stability protein PilW [Gallionellales bacterium GWA2_60_142]|jgi:type IV pilus assembly protein PilF|nr:MAG: type IV pilus biogenesis/stability protein PilW [Gallionellales bacterium GWA2_60_142]HCI14564.1 type IV pilus biogenesis/stability protein PilW [Gallionellaceae bacterium]
MKKFAIPALLLTLLSGCGTPSGGGGSQAPVQNDSRASASAKVHTELAGMYYERSQLGVALGEIAAALHADRNYAPAYNVRGLIHMALREDKEAEDDFQQSLQLDKGDSDAHNNYGWFLCQRDRAKESIPHFMAALKNPLYTTPERAYLNAGVCSQKAGKLKDAEEFLQRALLVQPGNLQALLALAELSFFNGDYPAAKKYFAGFAERAEEPTAEQLWLGVRIERRAGDRNAAASYAVQLRKRYPEARETQLMMQGE